MSMSNKFHIEAINHATELLKAVVNQEFGKLPPPPPPPSATCPYCGTPSREHKHSGKCLSCGAPLDRFAPPENKTGARLHAGVCLSTTQPPDDLYSPYGGYINSGTGLKRRR